MDMRAEHLDLVNVIDKERSLEMGECPVGLPEGGWAGEHNAAPPVHRQPIDKGAVEAAYVVLMLKHRGKVILEEAGDLVAIEDELGGRALSDREHRLVVRLGLKRLRERLIAPLSRRPAGLVGKGKKRVKVVPVAPSELVLFDGVVKAADEVGALDAVALDRDEVAANIQALADFDLSGLFADDA